MPHIKFESSDDEAMEKAGDHGGGSEEPMESVKQKSKKCKEPSSERHEEEMDTSDIDQKRLKAGQGDYSTASGSKEQKERKRSKSDLDDEDVNREAKEVRKDRSGSIDEKSERKKSDDRKERKEERFDKHGYEERREKPRSDDRRDDRSDRYRNDDRREKSDDYRRKNYDSNVPYKKPRRDDFDDRGPHRDRDDRQGGRFDNRRRDDYRNRDRDERDNRYQRKDDRRDYGGPRRGDYRGGGGYRRGGQDRNSDRGGRWRGNDDRREKEDRSTWDVRPSAEEVAKQKKLLWGSKSAAAPSGEGSSEAGEANAPEASAAPSNVTKNAGLWASAITASGVAGEQANKFLKLMGVKNAPAVDPNSTDSQRLQEESEKQKKMMRDLDRQYAIARETTHMGRGLGLGFHQ
ncbi:hypothetical protein ANCCAN_05330 [Ancylostoma caninum]|uniref:Small acidic protein-like domain-containing protein n=1 Tax=Ancylostoma caninum TaxID=29170 RepID=A0A368GZB2_ANCCA|nr:hypothetical protein ANCCAN_05330 [Ancylostoma caninum]